MKSTDRILLRAVLPTLLLLATFEGVRSSHSEEFPGVGSCTTRTPAESTSCAEPIHAEIPSVRTGDDGDSPAQSRQLDEPTLHTYRAPHHDEGVEAEDDSEEEDEEDYEEDDFSESFYLEPTEWGEPQKIVDGPIRMVVAELVEVTKAYMSETVFEEAEYEAVRYHCRNFDPLCSQWAVEGYCDESGPEDYAWMVNNCSPACQTCDILGMNEYFQKTDIAGGPYRMGEKNEDEPASAEKGELTLSRWGTPQNSGSSLPDRIQSVLDKTDRYMEGLMNDEESWDFVMNCQNRHQDCSYWAESGECERNEVYMQVNCGPACRSCDMLDFDARCPVDTNATEVLTKPGDLDRIFESLVGNLQWANDRPVTIVSSPNTTGGPWVVTIDNFLTDLECERFIEIGHETGFELSLDVSPEIGFDGSTESVPSPGRTSTNAWCPESCAEDPIVGPALARVDALTGIHYNNSEYLQLLRYESGQFYNEHHDMIHQEIQRPQGPRILTVFLYLNDVEKGGGTQFGKLGLTVMPKKGRALIWPSVLDSSPKTWDRRTMHEALIVEGGIKYGANAWIHLRDYKSPYERNCV